jgi:hypothetical protein
MPVAAVLIDRLYSCTIYINNLLIELTVNSVNIYKKKWVHIIHGLVCREHFVGDEVYSIVKKVETH